MVRALLFFQALRGTAQQCLREVRYTIRPQGFASLREIGYLTIQGAVLRQQVRSGKMRTSLLRELLGLSGVSSGFVCLGSPGCLGVRKLKDRDLQSRELPG